MNKEQNRKLSVGPADDTLSVDGFNVNEEILTMRVSLRNFGESLAKLQELGLLLDKIGGPLPYGLRAATANVDPLDRSVSDSEFSRQMAKINTRNPDPIQAALAYGHFAQILTGDISKLEHRVKKLCERTRTEKSGPEFENAKRMKQTCRDALAVLERRLSIVLVNFFKARNRSIDGITRVTSAVYNLFPSGSPALRSAYLESKTDSLETFKFLDDRFALGLTKHGCKTCHI